MDAIIEWVLLFLAAEAILSLAQYALRDKIIKPAARVAVIIAKAFTAVLFAFLVLGGPVFLRPIQIPLVALYAALLPDAAADALGSLWHLIRRGKRAFLPVKILSIILSAVFFIIGTVNMQIVSPNYHTYVSDKLSREYKVVFISDLHVGSAQSFGTVEKTVESIRSESPDLVILGGDITDDYTSKEEMEKTYSLFGNLGVPVYFIDGNHEVVQHGEYLADGLPYTSAELYDTIERNGIVVLRDEYAEINSEITLLGREDSASDKRKTAAELNVSADGKLLIVADHQPGSFKDHAAIGADLQLSGHVHAGQLFPLGSIESLFMYVYGEYNVDGATMFVTSGACGWRAPFRTDGRCEFDVITHKPAN